MSGFASGMAKWIYDNPEIALYKENGKYHISSSYFLDVQNREPILASLSAFIVPMQIANLVGISQGIDHGIQAITTWLGMKLSKPSSAYTEGEYDPQDTKMKSNFANCCLLTTYTSHKQQIVHLLKIIERFGGNPIQMISLVDEKGEAIGVCSAAKVNFQKAMSLSEIVNSLRTLPNVDAKKVEAIVGELER